MNFLLFVSALAISQLPSVLPGGSCRRSDGTCHEGWTGTGRLKVGVQEVCDTKEYSPKPCPRAQVFGACVGPTWREYFTIGNRQHPHPDLAEKNCHHPLGTEHWTWAAVPARRARAIAAAVAFIKRQDVPFSCRYSGTLNPYCSEALDPSRKDAKRSCDGSDYTVAQGACPRANLSGSCLRSRAVLRFYVDPKQSAVEQAHWCVDSWNGVFFPNR